ncbi:hypothetical protein FX988_04363 (plasmid) [Paraglaciecola mesophila]|uniref:DUF7668 domain-containing protein n=1 Tax=Paraglaciecola mesophila TaxID=197222 RepID=A0A857JSE0_9ALTE|nr:hypothetical protein [Paraglaciecola mesophila]QHJ14081.1 hypothetical protein FX988_04363 [Paraglaciecola mesophila]
MTVPIVKDEETQQPIPTIWRDTIVKIVDAIRFNNIDDFNAIPYVKGVSEKDAEGFQENIEDYGCRLTNLPDATWQSSTCQWMREYWDALIDLYTVEEGESDLALYLRVHEKGQKFEFEVMSIHVG